MKNEQEVKVLMQYYAGIIQLNTDKNDTLRDAAKRLYNLSTELR